MLHSRSGIEGSHRHTLGAGCIVEGEKEVGAYEEDGLQAERAEAVPPTTRQDWSGKEPSTATRRHSVLSCQDPEVIAATPMPEHMPFPCQELDLAATIPNHCQREKERASFASPLHHRPQTAAGAIAPHWPYPDQTCAC